MKPTRLDVAKLAGVSPATVSNVMNNAQKVRGETVERVQAAMAQLNYQPNMVARSLTTRKTMQIGLVLENIRNPYYGEIVEHFEAAASARGYFVNICIGTQNIDHYLDNFVTRRLDGVFVAALPHMFDMSKLDQLLENDIRVLVSGNTDVDYRRFSSIESDYAAAMRMAVKHLAGLGHSEIVYLSGLSHEMRYDLRCDAYQKQMTELGLCPVLIDGDPPYQTDVRAGYRQASRLLSSQTPFTAVICGNDLMAIGAMRAFFERGLRVPEDISVVGFDGIDLGRFQTPSLTTLAVDARDFGEKAFELLYASMTQETTSFYSSKLKLIHGESTAQRR